MWFPILIAWFKANFEPRQVLHIAIDRTTWGCVNLLMVSWIEDKRAIPIYCQLLPKLGRSNFQEQQVIISKVLPLLKEYKVVVLGDARILLCPPGKLATAAGFVLLFTT